MNATKPYSVDEVEEFLKNSTVDVFSTMFNLGAGNSPLSPLRESGLMLVVGSVGFIGDANGVVYVYVADTFARTLACRMLGMTDTELEGHEIVNDVIGELTNMIVGAVKSRLCDSGVQCVLTIPSIVRGQNIIAEPALSSECRTLGFICDSEPVLVELLMKPS